MSEEISGAIDQFIRDYIRSVEQLEVLLFLMEHAQQEWSAAEIAQKIYRQPQSVTSHLEILQRDGLLSRSGVEVARYRYAPMLTSTDASVRELDKAYRERKDTVIRLIFSRPPDALRSFSDAFRLRKDS